MTHQAVHPVHLVQKARWFSRSVHRHKMLYVTTSVMALTGKDCKEKVLQHEILGGGSCCMFSLYKDRI